MTSAVNSLVAAVALGACAHPRYLEAPLPHPCITHDVEGCLGWMVERDLAAAELDLYDDTALRDYVQGIADRLAQGSRLPNAPRVVISDHDGTYATSGSRIVLGRPTLERLDSEAELAGVVAHELAHIEGHHAVVSLFGPPPGDDALVLGATPRRSPTSARSRCSSAPATLRRRWPARSSRCSTPRTRSTRCAPTGSPAPG